MKCSAFSKLKYEGFSGTEQQKIYNCSQTFYISVVNVFNMSYTLASMTFNAVYKTRQKYILSSGTTHYQSMLKYQ